MTAQENNPLPRELAAGVWWLGQCYEIPFMGKLVHNNNAVFLVAGTEYSALVETGIPWDTELLLRQLDEVIGTHGLPEPRYIFNTHSEQAHSGGVGHLLAKYAEAEVHGDISDLHLVFPQFVDRMHFAEPGERYDLGGRQMVVVESVFRDLVTSRWFFDTGSRALFTGDGFAYAHYHDNNACGMFVEEAPEVDLPQQMVYFAMSAFHWTGFVDLEPYSDRIEELVFDELSAKMILSTHGLPVGDVQATMPRIRAGFQAMAEAEPASVAALDDVLGS